jgi:hypothetical protein
MDRTAGAQGVDNRERPLKTASTTGMLGVHFFNRSSRVKPDYFRMPEIVPLARSSCKGTTVLQLSFRRLTWLSFRLTVSRPLFSSALISARPDYSGSLPTYSYLERIEDCFTGTLGGVISPKARQMEFYGLFELGLSLFNRLPLAHYAKLDAMSNVPLVLFGDYGCEFLCDLPPPILLTSGVIIW